MPDTLALDTRDGVQTITLNRPDRLNALSRALMSELSEALRAAERDDGVRVVVLTGAGRAFSAGADIGEFGALAAEQGASDGTPRLGSLLRQHVNPLVLRLHTLEKPLLAAVNGTAAGAGLSLALACDVRYAGESARFIQAFVGLGLVPDGGSTYFLPRLVGMAKALELSWTGEALPAGEALALGLVNRVVPDGELLSQTQDLAARLAHGPATALALTKRGMRKGHELPLERLLELEADYQEVASRTPDFAEGARAFREKRRPTFGGA